MSFLRRFFGDLFRVPDYRMLLLRGSQDDIDGHPAMERELVFNKTAGHCQIYRDGRWINVPEMDGYCLRYIRRADDGAPHQILEAACQTREDA